MYCGQPLTGKRQGALFCKDAHRKRYSRWQQKIRSEGYEPPPSGPSVLTESRAHDTFRRQLDAEGTRAMPLTDEEIGLLAAQRRNPGVLHPGLHKRLLDREYDRMRQEAEEASRADAIKVENPLDPSTLGSVRRRAIQSRRANRHYPRDPNEHVLRPPPGSGPGPWDDEPQCISSPWGRNTPRSML